MPTRVERTSFVNRINPYNFPGCDDPCNLPPHVLDDALPPNFVFLKVRRNSFSLPTEANRISPLISSTRIKRTELFSDTFDSVQESSSDVSPDHTNVPSPATTSPLIRPQKPPLRQQVLQARVVSRTSPSPSERTPEKIESFARLGLTPTTDTNSADLSLDHTSAPSTASPSINKDLLTHPIRKNRRELLALCKLEVEKAHQTFYKNRDAEISDLAESFAQKIFETFTRQIFQKLEEVDDLTTSNSSEIEPIQEGIHGHPGQARFLFRATEEDIETCSEFQQAVAETGCDVVPQTPNARVNFWIKSYTVTHSKTTHKHYRNFATLTRKKVEYLMTQFIKKNQFTPLKFSVAVEGQRENRQGWKKSLVPHSIFISTWITPKTSCLSCIFC